MDRTREQRGCSKEKYELESHSYLQSEIDSSNIWETRKDSLVNLVLTARINGRETTRKLPNGRANTRMLKS